MRPSIPTRLWIRRPSPTSARRIYPIKIMALYAVESVIGTACVLRIGTTSDTVRARTASERSGRRSICGAATIGACERCGSEPRASVTERALRALLDEFTASARPAATRTSTANLCSSRCSRRSVQGHDRRPLRLGIVSSFVMKPIGEPTAQGSARSTV